ncbi:hypothetical protein GCM10027275_45430 [Rhabdobacter roseus]|uniref:Prevent-host-death protein n=1 Tax=Rhabdobacter roseus TaxID=1655419 RepID=A0A840U377_9BACT|nr:prevent-host-death protein [Rhabdobacter roseus]MBB5286788.1 hypothetical protein [Rhabdobacter roseus]
MNIQYVSNAKGEIMAVQLPLKAWREIEKKLEALAIAESIRKGYQDMEQIEKGELPAKTLEDLLNEL